MSKLNFDPDHPYAFICYKREDKDIVMADLEILQDKYNINLWFDEDMTTWREWDDEAKEKLRSHLCEAVLFYASPAALLSRNTQLELEDAEKWDVPILPIPIKIKDRKFLYYVKMEYSKAEDKSNYDMDGAHKMISRHLPSNRTYISPGDPGYYEEIFKAIKRDYSDIIKDNINASQTLEKEDTSIPSIQKIIEPDQIFDETTTESDSSDKETVLKVKNWFWEYAEKRGIKRTDPPGSKSTYGNFSTENLEKIFGFTDTSDNPRKVRNIAFYGFSTGKQGKSCDMFIGLSAPISADKEDLQKILDKMKEHTGITKSFYDDNGKVKPSIYSKIIDAKNVTDGGVTKEDITTKTIKDMVDKLIDLDNEWFGNVL